MDKAPDISTLSLASSNPEFDVNAWINQNFDKSCTSKELFNSLDNFWPQLDNEIQRTTNSLNTLTQQVITQVPRVARELDVLHKEVEKLQSEIISGFNHAENVQEKTTLSMNTLEKLDNIKSNLLGTTSALQEADKWTSLGKEVEQHLDAGDVHKSYECIVAMEKSLAVLDSSASEERYLVLEEVKNRLEALATKHIIQAFETNDIENAKNFYKMFSNLERTTQFVKYFENCEKLKLSQEWRNLVELNSFKEAVTKFYSYLVDHLHSKIDYCKVIFAKDSFAFAIGILLGLYSDTFGVLEPSLQFCFEAETKKQSFIDIFSQFNETTQRFSDTIRQYVEANCERPLEPGKILKFQKILFVPFVPQYSKYMKYVESTISSKIQDSVKSISSSNPSNELSSVVQEKIDCSKRTLPDIILQIKELEEKLSGLSHGFLHYHFCKGVNLGLDRYVDWCKEVYRTLEKSSINSDRQRTILENVLSFSVTCGSALRQMDSLNNTLSSNSHKIMSSLQAPSQSEWDYYSEIYFTPIILTEIQQLLHGKKLVLNTAISNLKNLCRDSTKLVLKVTAEPIETQLQKNFVLSDCNLKEAIPSEYITQMGEYLMLLPQNLDPFISTESGSLNYAFEEGDESKSPVDYILSNLCLHVCDIYCERLLKISFLTEGQAKQLAQDIEYLSSVMEDLNVKLTQNLQDFHVLMKRYSNLNEIGPNFKVSSKILSAVRKLKTKPVTM